MGQDMETFLETAPEDYLKDFDWWVGGRVGGVLQVRGGGVWGMGWWGGWFYFLAGGLGVAGVGGGGDGREWGAWYSMGK